VLVSGRRELDTALRSVSGPCGRVLAHRHSSFLSQPPRAVDRQRKLGSLRQHLLGVVGIERDPSAAVLSGCLETRRGALGGAWAQCGAVIWEWLARSRRRRAVRKNADRRIPIGTTPKREHLSHFPTSFSDRLGLCTRLYSPQRTQPTDRGTARFDQHRRHETREDDPTRRLVRRRSAQLSRLTWPALMRCRRELDAREGDVYEVSYPLGGKGGLSERLCSEVKGNRRGSIRDRGTLETLELCRGAPPS